MSKHNYIIGSVSSGTMRPEDLIPDFIDVARDLGANDNEDHKKTLAEIEQRMEADDYFDTEEANWDLEELFDILQKYAPPYFYFGASDCDGADYGFWLYEYPNVAQEIKDNGGVVVSDLSELDKFEDGGIVEVLHVNDHGNVTLYSYNADTKELDEIWAIV